MLRWKNIWTIAWIVTCCVPLAGAQMVERIVTSFDGGRSLSHPLQLTLSPTSASMAVSDQSANRIYVLDTDGQLLWSVGEITPITEPMAVCFEAENVLLFSCKNRRLIYRVTKTTLNSVDTVADLTTFLPKDATIDQILGITGQAHLILDRHRSAVYRFKSNWEKDNQIIADGSREGELWVPAAIAIDLSGNIIVADEGNYPLQVFSPAGRFLFRGGWNATQSKQIWTASAVAVTRSEQIWVADVTGLKWRVFDRTGYEINQYPFVQPVFHPSSILVTPDNRLVVVDARGAIVILRLP